MPVAKFIITILVTLSLTASYGQSTEQLISNIRTEFKRINSSEELDQIRLSNEEFMEHMTDGGGSLTGYFENGNLVKIVEWIGLSFGNREIEYYLKNDSLFFAFEVESRFADKEGGLLAEFDYSKLVTAFEGRYYFNNTELIKKIEQETEFNLFTHDFDKRKFLQNSIKRAQQLRTKYKN